jgi:predicted molibdopterin-dependent oxidoreductase YjgC
METVTINDLSLAVPEGTTILQAARQLGILIPTLCDHPRLTPYGGCRLCVVEVKGERLPQTACTRFVENGMVVRTETPALVTARRLVLSLLLSLYADTGYAADDREKTEFMRWVAYYGAQPTEEAPQRYPVNSDPNPFVWVDRNKCILCMRCIRACAEVQGRYVWGLHGRGLDTRIAAGRDTPLLEARCESCGACVTFCPTGALDDKMSVGLGRPDKVVTTTCGYCGVGCNFDLHVKDNRIIRVAANPDAPVNGLSLCVKGHYGYDYVNHPDRLTRPRVRQYLLEGEGVRPAGQPRGPWVEVDWEVALNIAARKLRAARDTHGPDSVGVLTSAKCTNEENYLMNKFTRQVIGTNSIDHCARL